MNQIEAQYQEILRILDKLLANLGLVLEDYDAEYLTQADLYIEIFKIMFPALEHDLNADFGEDVTDEDLIQYLVNILAKDIIKMDLGHIRGELIAQGDAKSILNFLQLLLEISNMIGAEKSRDKGKKKPKKKKQIRSSGNSVDQVSDLSQKSSIEIRPKYNSAQGITAEFSSSAEGESNPEGQSGRESYIDENGDAYYNEAQISENLMQNKAIYEQQKNLKQDSRSVSRISEVSKSKESSEYDKGTGSKKLSQKFDDFNPGGLHRRGIGQNGTGARYGSYASDDVRGNVHHEKEEDEALEEYGEEEGNEYGLQHEPGFTEESMRAHEEEEAEENQRDGEGEENLYTDEQEYIPAEEGEDEVLEEEDNDYSEQGMRKISGDGETEDVEYYTNDPINYQPMGKGNSRLSYEAEREEISRRNMPSEAKIQRHDAHEQEEEYYGQEEEYEEQEGEYEEQEEERDQIEDNGEYEEEEREEIPEGQIEMDPQHMEYVDGMEQVVEEHDEDNYDEESYGDRRGQAQYEYEQETVGHAQQAVKSKGKSKGKTKAAGKKKKSSSKAIDDYAKGKVQHRPLKPATAGMKVKRDKKSETKKSTARKSDDSASTQRSKKLVHSKSERNLNVAEEPSQSQLNEDYSEDRGLEPKEYQQDEEGQQEEQEYQEGNQRQEEYEVQEEVDQIPDGNVFKILSDNVMRVKENLRENRAIEEIPFDDERTAKMIMQQKNQYKQYLKDFMKDHQLREKKYETMRQLGEKNFIKKMRSEKVKDDHMRKDFENQQKSLYFKMRDEKVNYLRRVHKTIFELEKKRIIEDKKEYMEFRTSRNREAQNMIDSIKNEYKNKLSVLRERNQNQQTERKIANEAQRAFIQAFEKELKMDQMREVERLKNKWRHEKEKFDMMIKDEGFLERKIMELYKKGHF